MQKCLFLSFMLIFLIGCQGKEVEKEILEEKVLIEAKVADEEQDNLNWYIEAEITDNFISEDHLELAETIDNFLIRYKFNGVVLVALQDELVILNAYGLASVENQVPMTVNTQFQVGSISKPILGVAILQLVEAGLLTLDQTIDEFFPDLERGNEITIHQLLTHSSGLNSGDGLGNYSSFTTPDQLIAYAFKNIHYHNEPGFVVYSNLGYDMLGVIVEIVTGMSYDEYIQKNILDVSHMVDSGLNVEGKELENLATAYAGHITQGEPARVFHPSFGFASGGVHSTAFDLFRFSQALYQNLLITPFSYELMTTPFTTISGVGYGYGWFINPRGHENVISHNGDLLGWHSILLRHQKNDFTVVLLTNQSASTRNVNMAHTIVNLVINH